MHLLHYIIAIFSREPLGTAGRFTITPQRHYPLQQPGVSSVGVLPPVRWDGFRKKNILSPRNSPAALSPVTVKIARPDHHSSPRSLHSWRHLVCHHTSYTVIKILSLTVHFQSMLSELVITFHTLPLSSLCLVSLTLCPLRFGTLLVIDVQCLTKA